MEIKDLLIEDKLKIFRYNIGLLRVSKELKSDDIEKELGFANKRYNNLEGKHHLPNFEEIVLIANYFNVPMSVLLDSKITLNITTL
jgi:transcriptional regulator with XRE-family HTH domain